MRVVTTCSSSSYSFCQKLGADECIDYKENPDFLNTDERCKAVDCVFDPFGYLYRTKTFDSTLPVLGEDAWYIDVASSPNSLTEARRQGLIDPLKIAIPEASMPYLLDAIVFKIANSVSNFLGNFHLLDTCRKVQPPPSSSTEQQEAQRRSPPRRGSGWTHHGPTFVNSSGRDMRKIARLVREGKVLPVLSKKNVLPFSTEGVVQAHKRIEDGHIKGKVVIKVSSREEARESLAEQTGHEEKD
jgi:NADPH:quinone reductase-like Zn-dependent oxidoreductase